MLGTNKRTNSNSDNKSSKKMKQQTWDYSSAMMKDPKMISTHDDDDNQEEVELLPSEFLSWPPSSYTCTFCKRGFRSAQALGGHMNIHRRDKARLRQYSPLREATSSSSSSSCFDMARTRIESWHKSVEMTKKKALVHQDLGSLLNYKKESSSAATTTKNGEIDALDLQIGLQKQDLDLELRLGR